MKPIPLGVRFYKNRSLPASAQNLTNLYLETLSAQAKSPVVLHKIPGNKAYKTVGSGPIRGMYELSGMLYVVSGVELYTVSKSLDSKLLGNIAGAGLVGMKINDRETGPQLVITNGTYTQYLYTTAEGLSTQTLTGPAYHVEYQDGYYIYDWTGTGKWFISSILDGTSHDSLETGATNANPDPVIRIVSTHQQLWVFGSVSREVFYNGDLGDFPFVRITEATDDLIGLGARWSLVEMDNTIFWVGSDREVYRAVGYNAQQISDPAISEALRDVNLDKVTAFTYSDGGHKFYQLNLDDKALVFDAKESIWHMRAYWNNGAYEKPRAATYVRFNDLHVIGDHTTNQLYTMDMNYYKDANAKPLRWEMVTPPIHNSGSYLNIPNLYIDFEAGVGLAGESDPGVTVEVSDDARTYHSGRNMSMGKTGDYTSRAILRRMGGTRHQKVFRISGSAAVKTTILGAYYGSF